MANWKTYSIDILKNDRAEYGKEIVVTLSQELTTNFGNSFKDKNFRRMIQFYEKFPEFDNVVTLYLHQRKYFKKRSSCFQHQWKFSPTDCQVQLR